MPLKVLFRCDAAYIKGIGSGHLIRCIVIARTLEKYFKFKKKDFLFIIKSVDKYILGRKIINKYNYSFLQIKKNITKINEIKTLMKFKSKLLIVDKYKFYDTSTYNAVKKNFEKIILIDAYNKKYKNIKYLNPTFNKANIYKPSILIIPSLLIQKSINKKINNEIKNIFIFFGSFDFKKIQLRIINLLNKIEGNFKIFISENYKSKFKKVKGLIYYNENNFFSYLKKSDLAITSGGLIMYDVMNLNVPLIIFPQIKHQILNSNYYKKNKCLISILLNKNLSNNFINAFKIIKDRKSRYSMIKRQQKIFTKKKRQKILKILKKCI
jgi:spore coat polysaccharide biosynthesis predicted glycosyltransferase SpsG|tara:strand:+ start:980 stop:1951 length:972 start_codon:yes stop_codon:yes gene_type:complete